MSQLFATLWALAAVCCISACSKDRPTAIDPLPAAAFDGPTLAPATKVENTAPAPVDSAAPAARAAATPDDPSRAATPFPSSSGRSIQWKRNAALEADLMRGLSLTREEVCRELGSQSCIRDVHTVALGGNDPFGSGLLRPSTSSLSTTPLAIDRVTLSACSYRARADKRGDPKVFTALDLSGPVPTPDSQEISETINTLFHRLLARDPKPGESTIIKGLLRNDTEPTEPMTAVEFATLSCFVVASSLESLFF